MIRYFDSFDAAIRYSKSTGVRLPAPFRRLLFQNGAQIVKWAVAIRPQA